MTTSVKVSTDAVQAVAEALAEFNACGYCGGECDACQGEAKVAVAVARPLIEREAYTRGAVEGGVNARWNQANIVGQAIGTGRLDGTNAAAVAAAIRAETPEEFQAACDMSKESIGRKILAAATEAITDEEAEAVKGTGLVCFRRRVKLETAIEQYRKAWLAGDEDEIEHWFDFIMDGDWSRQEFFTHLLSPAIQWENQQQELQRKIQ